MFCSKYFSYYTVPFANNAEKTENMTLLRPPLKNSQQAGNSLDMILEMVLDVFARTLYSAEFFET